MSAAKDATKVTVRRGGPMHVENPDRGGYTLCGLRWWFECNKGDTYCRRCQRILGGICRKQNAPLTGDSPVQGVIGGPKQEERR